MFIGVSRLEILIPGSSSLKDKRQVLRSITGSVRGKFPVAIAEVDYQDLWQRAAFGVACVASSISHCRQVLQEVEKTVARTSTAGGAELIERATHVASWEDL